MTVTKVYVGQDKDIDENSKTLDFSLYFNKNFDTHIRQGLACNIPQEEHPSATDKGMKGMLTRGGVDFDAVRK